MFFRLNKSYKSLSDKELITLYRKKNEKQIVGILFKRYTHLVFGSCMKYLKNADESEDAVMDIFEKLLEDLKIHQIDNFKSWLYSVARNHCLMQLRKEKSSKSGVVEFKINDVERVESIDLLHLNEEVEKEQSLQGLETAIADLNDEQRRCIELFYLEQKCYNEVAEITTYSLKEVKSYIQNGKRNIKMLMLNQR
ncbi:MAG: RNA polymerase subunit sigma-24 [Bacteroidetes bacterium]|nr:MAG: RNA polymerase subunit sigma-24 [Bacteroidota bacterium]